MTGLSGPKAPRALHSSTPEELSAFARADALGDPMLIWRDGEGRQQLQLLDPGRRYSLGRRRTMSVPIDWDAKVSKLHAELECIDGEWVITDDGLSRNGTFINERRIHERGRLRHEDKIRVGLTVLEFRAATDDLELADTEDEDGAGALPDFTRGELDVLRELCRNCFADGAPNVPVSNNEIAERLFLALRTVTTRLASAYAKCGYPDDVTGRRALVMDLVIARGIVTPSDFR
jgi:DNA-binding CsgD family transcriptional regulator